MWIFVLSVVVALEWQNWGEWTEYGTEEEQLACESDGGTRGIDVRTRGCTGGSIEDCIAQLAGKEIEERYSRVYYACLCQSTDSHYESRFYMELLHNQSGFLTVGTTDVRFTVAVPVQFHDIQFSFANSTYDRAAYPSSDMDNSPWHRIVEAETCDQKEIWQADISWTLLNEGLSGGVFEIFEYPVYDDDSGAVVSYEPFERMWAFTLIMGAKEVFKADAPREISRSITGDKEIEYRIPLIVKFQMRLVVESDVFGVSKCSFTMRDPRCDERFMFSITAIQTHSVKFDEPPYATVDFDLLTRAKYPYKFKSNVLVPLTAVLELDPNPPHTEQTLYNYVSPGQTTQGLNQLIFLSEDSEKCQFPDDTIDSNYVCSITQLDTNAHCWDQNYQCNECCGTNFNQANEYCWNRDGLSRMSCCGMEETVDLNLNNLWCEQQWRLTLQPANCYITGTYTLLYSMTCFEGKPSACAYREGTRTLDNGMTLTDQQVAISFDVESSRLCPTMVDRIDLSGEICLTCVGSSGVAETHCGELIQSGYGCAYKVGDNVDFEVLTSSQKASIARSEIVAIYIENPYTDLFEDVDYDPRFNVTGGFQIWTESDNDGYFDVQAGETTKRVFVIRNTGNSLNTGEPRKTTFRMNLDKDVFPVNADGFADFYVYVTVRADYEGYISSRRQLQEDSTGQEISGMDEFTMRQRIRVTSERPIVRYHYTNAEIHTQAPVRATLLLSLFSTDSIIPATSNLQDDLNEMLNSDSQVIVDQLYTTHDLDKPTDIDSWRLELFIYPTSTCEHEKAPIFIAHDLVGFVRSTGQPPFYSLPFFSDKKVSEITLDSIDNPNVFWDNERIPECSQQTIALQEASSQIASIISIGLILLLRL